MKPTILVCDDDAGVRYTLREILEAGDMEVVEAADGEAALEHLRTSRADLLITDLRMPRLDGMKLLRRLGSSSSPPTARRSTPWRP